MSFMDEKHYTPPQLAKMWGMSASLVRSLFENEEGVIRIERSEQRFKRGYTSLRISESAAKRVYARLTAVSSNRSLTRASPEKN